MNTDRYIPLCCDEGKKCPCRYSCQLPEEDGGSKGLYVTPYFLFALIVSLAIWATLILAYFAVAA